jgi:hypothetical protein
VNVPLLLPPSAVVNALAPLALPLIDAVTVWFTVEPVPFELFVKKFVTVFVSIVVVEVYLLAVVDSKEVPAASVSADPVASSKLAHKCGLVPCAESDIVKLLELKFAGALGVDFMTKVIVWLSF